jgi:hypothetical protein
MSEYDIPAEAAIAAATANMAMDAYDADGTQRIKKVTMAQIATYLRGNNGNNTTATTDPGVSNDSTQGYFVGSIWVNTTNGRVWIAQAVGTGVAAWALAVVPGTGIEPSSNLEQFGAGTATVLAEGNINRQISSAGISPGATGADNVLAVFSIPANSFDISGRGIGITAQGKFGATANNKQIKLIFNPATAVVGSTVGAGGTTVADTGAVATNGGGWSVQANVFKYGAAASNTQIGLHQQAQIGAATAALLAPSLITATESGPILVAVTGNATTAASDIVFNFLEVNAMN